MDAAHIRLIRRHLLRAHHQDLLLLLLLSLQLEVLRAKTARSDVVRAKGPIELHGAAQRVPEHILLVPAHIAEV